MVEDKKYNIEVILAHKGSFTTKQPYIQNLKFLTKWEDYEKQSWEPFKNIKQTTPFKDYVKKTFKG